MDETGSKSALGDLAALEAIYSAAPAVENLSFSLELSIGYQVRTTHRALQRHLSSKIAPYGITLGMWYFLRVLWHREGLTQRELSNSIGTMEPTTLNAILSMERRGLVRRVRDKADRRRQLVYLTPKGRALSADVLPRSMEVVRDATAGLTIRELAMLLELLRAIQTNLASKLDAEDFPDEEIA